MQRRWPWRASRTPFDANWSHDPAIPRGAVNAERHLIHLPSRPQRPWTYNYASFLQSAKLLCRLLDAAACLANEDAGTPRHLRAFGMVEAESALAIGSKGGTGFRAQATDALAQAYWHQSLRLAAEQCRAPYFSERSGGGGNLSRTLGSVEVSGLIEEGILSERWLEAVRRHGLRWTYDGDPALAHGRPWDWQRLDGGAYAHGGYHVAQDGDGGWNAWHEDHADAQGRRFLGQGMLDRHHALQACAICAGVPAARHTWPAEAPDVDQTRSKGASPAP